VGAPTYFQSPVLAAAPPTLAPPLAGSSTGASPEAHEGGTPEAVRAPTHFQSLPSKFNASIYNYSNSNSLIFNSDSPKFNSPKFNSSISSSSISNATDPSPEAPAGVALEAVVAPIHPHSPVLAAVHPFLRRPLAGSSTEPCPRAPDGGAPEAVGAPTHFQSPVLAAVPPFLSPPLAGFSTGPSPGPLKGEPPRLWEPLSSSKVQPWQHHLPPWPHTWLVPPLGTALGPLVGEPMSLWGSLLIS